MEYLTNFNCILFWRERTFLAEQCLLLYNLTVYSLNSRKKHKHTHVNILRRELLRISQMLITQHVDSIVDKYFRQTVKETRNVACCVLRIVYRPSTLYARPTTLRTCSRNSVIMQEVLLSIQLKN